MVPTDRWTVCARRVCSCRTNGVVADYSYSCRRRSLLTDHRDVKSDIQSRHSGGGAGPVQSTTRQLLATNEVSCRMFVGLSLQRLSSTATSFVRGADYTQPRLRSATSQLQLQHLPMVHLLKGEITCRENCW